MFVCPSCHCNERLFLRDLVVCTPGTSGGRLARWLQPESHVDPARCQLLYPRDEMRCGWPAVVNLTTKDQYGQVVHVPYLKIEVKAVPIDKKEAGDSRKVRRVSQPDELTFGGHAQPSLDTPYEATVRDQMCYNAITMMKVYENYSFEELRYTSPAVKRTSETMLVRPNSDGTYSATWTPGSVGWYCIHATIDGYTMEEVHKVEVKDPPQGIMPPTQSHTPRKATHQPNRLRKFVARNSAGLRVRAHPSLQSEQIGVVHVNGTIAFVDEIHNDDGVWLRLTQDTIRQYCHNSYPEAWCLQYNQHLGKTLLLPLQEPKTVLDHVVRESRGKPTTSHEIPKVLEATSYKVVKCGASGHNVRSSPSLTAPPIGMLHFGNHITVTCHSINKEGTWVQLDKDTISNCCFNLEEEAWSLATDKNNFVYLRPDKIEKDSEAGPSSSPDVFSPSLSKASQRGFDFSGPDNPTVFPVFTPPSSSVNNSNPFVFGSSVPALPVKDETKTSLKDSSIKSSGPKWFKPAEEPKPPTSKVSYSRDMPPELAGVSVKDLVKAIGESRANGNGVTPPDTPRRLSRSSSPLVSRDSRSSSPVPIPGIKSISITLMLLHTCRTFFDHGDIEQYFHLDLIFWLYLYTPRLITYDNDFNTNAASDRCYPQSGRNSTSTKVQDYNSLNTLWQGSNQLSKAVLRQPRPCFSLVDLRRAQLDLGLDCKQAVPILVCYVRPSTLAACVGAPTCICTKS
ncbi:hypothetical protein J6590_041863 [Homalodisca vitripennis]|nr:hypothetical protein J6590_041863 [Homalodisca vitripennis]